MKSLVFVKEIHLKLMVVFITSTHLLIMYKTHTFLFRYHYVKAVAILPLTAIYPQRLFCCELFVIGQS